jgi:hypothetical protein
MEIAVTGQVDVSFLTLLGIWLVDGVGLGCEVRSVADDGPRVL